MGDRYVATGLQTAVEVSPGETILSVFSPGTTNRAWVYYVAISTRAGAMADQVQTAQLQRTTVQGTEGAGVVPAPTDFDAPASISDGGTIEETDVVTIVHGFSPGVSGTTNAVQVLDMREYLAHVNEGRATAAKS